MLLDKVTTSYMLFALVENNDGTSKMQSLKPICNVCIGGEITPFYPIMINLNICHQLYQCYCIFYKYHASKHIHIIQFYFQLQLHSRFLFALYFMFTIIMIIISCE